MGDRWSLLIVRELAMFGPQGFNTLASGLPGRISRSVLVARLRNLERLGIVGRTPAAGPQPTPYQLTPAGEQLVPTLHSLWQWAERWVPEDPGLARRDPAIVLWWLRHRLDRAALPARQVAIQFSLPLSEAERQWLLVAAGNEPEACLEDPLLGEDRYVFVDADAEALYPIARGQRSWEEAVGDGSVTLYGDPSLVAELPGWFLPPESSVESPALAS
jgi:DNA-binding HxlR family transcriptional regulator